MSEGAAHAKSYRDLKAWQRSMDLVVACATICRALYGGQAAGMAQQIQRASISVPANIAEGNGRRTRADYLRHLSIANGSLLEVETHLLVLRRLGLAHVNHLEPALALTSEVGKLLAGLIRKSVPRRRADPRPDPGQLTGPSPPTLDPAPGQLTGPWPRPRPQAVHSYRNAAIGSNIAARLAGQTPNRIPTTAENTNASPIEPGATSVFH